MLKIVIQKPNCIDRVFNYADAENETLCGIPASAVTMVAAEGHDKDRAAKLAGLPAKAHGTMFFYGDFAKQIVGNW